MLSPAEKPGLRRPEPSAVRAAQAEPQGESERFGRSRSEAAAGVPPPPGRPLSAALSSARGAGGPAGAHAGGAAGHLGSRDPGAGGWRALCYQLPRLQARAGAAERREPSEAGRVAGRGTSGPRRHGAARRPSRPPHGARRLRWAFSGTVARANSTPGR